MLALRNRLTKQIERPARFRATSRNQNLTDGASESIGRSSSKEALQQLDQRFLLTRSDDADFEVN